MTSALPDPFQLSSAPWLASKQSQPDRCCHDWSSHGLQLTLCVSAPGSHTSAAQRHPVARKSLEGELHPAALHTTSHAPPASALLQPARLNSCCHKQAYQRQELQAHCSNTVHPASASLNIAALHRGLWLQLAPRWRLRCARSVRSTCCLSWGSWALLAGQQPCRQPVRRCTWLMSETWQRRSSGCGTPCLQHRRCLVADVLALDAELRFACSACSMCCLRLLCQQAGSL